MQVRNIISVGAMGALVISGCAAEEVAGPDPRGLKLTVAPLELEGIDVACYDVLVENAGAAYKAVGGGNDVVVLGDPAVKFPTDGGAICSNRYGNGPGGGITYIAPCDASEGADTNATRNGVQNRVTLWVDGLYENTGDAENPVYADIGTGTWQNPCVEGCSLDFDCQPNADTLVEFNFTILRDASQGFFDIIVNFDDIFCSAKVDCQYAPTQGQTVGQYIRLVHDQTGKRTFTVVAAVACTGGDFEGDEDEGRTHLYASDLVVDCGTTNVQEFAVDGEGNYYLPNDSRTAPVEQVMVFQGKESLQNGATNNDADKLYWNVAVGFKEAETSRQAVPLIDGGASCSLRWMVTASKGPIEDVFEKQNVTYPYISANVPISDGGTVLCGQHPVNGGNGVATAYTELGDSLPGDFAWEMSQVGTSDVDVDAWTPPANDDD